MWIKRGGKISKEGNIYSFYYCNNEFRKKRDEKKFNEYVIENNKFRGNRKVDVKVLEITNDVKEYDITVKLSKGSDKDKDNNYSFKWSNLSNYSYKPKTELAQTSIFIYKRKFVISMIYKYKVNSIESKNQSKLTKVS